MVYLSTTQDGFVYTVMYLQQTKPLLVAFETKLFRCMFIAVHMTDLVKLLNSDDLFSTVLLPLETVYNLQSSNYIYIEKSSLDSLQAGI